MLILDDAEYVAADVCHWLLATRRTGRCWLKTEAMLDQAFPGLDDETLDEALRLAGEILDGRRAPKWGTC